MWGSMECVMEGNEGCQYIIVCGCVIVGVGGCVIVGVGVGVGGRAVT